MTGQNAELVSGHWKFPKTKRVLVVAGLRTSKYYICVLRARMLNWVQEYF